MNMMSFPSSWLICNKAKDWHDWLEANYLTKTEVWLQISKAHLKDVGIKIDDSVEEAICFGWIDGKLYSLDKDKYILRFTPRRMDSLWSRKNKKRAEVLMESGRMTQYGLEKIRAAQKNGNCLLVICYNRCN